ncbi:hypothetical protein GCM10007886_31150 [Methylobacterium gregans]|nr:hypothetical protein GCM10007886_31150 [Methylobacterium gregans]
MGATGALTDGGRFTTLRQCNAVSGLAGKTEGVTDAVTIGDPADRVRVRRRPKNGSSHPTSALKFRWLDVAVDDRRRIEEPVFLA